MLTINDLVWPMSLFLIVGILVWVYLWTYIDKKREKLVFKFADYTAVLTYYMEKSYDMIHKDRILIYSLEATKLPDKEFNVYSKEFIRLTVKLLGPVLTSEFVKFFGNEDTFTFFLAEHFSSKYEGDEIRKASIENLMQSDIEAPEELKGGTISTGLPGQP